MNNVNINFVLSCITAIVCVSIVCATFKDLGRYELSRSGSGALFVFDTKTGVYYGPTGNKIDRPNAVIEYLEVYKRGAGNEAPPPSALRSLKLTHFTV